MEFFDYNTIGKTDEEVMQMAKNFEEGNDCIVQYFWACELYFRLAEKGNEEAIERLVTRCVLSNWLQDHFTISDSWMNVVKDKWEKRIDQEDKEACRLLAFCYVDGFGNKVDDEKAVNLLMKAISLNDYRVLNSLGWMINNKRFVDGKTAKDYFREAAEKDVAIAMVNLVSDETDINKKLYWLEKAASLNYSRAYYSLGQLYTDKSFIKSDEIKAFEYYKKASELGYYRAYKKMAEAYRYGNGINVDINLSMYWYCMYCDIDTKDNYIDVDIYEYAKANKKEIKKEILEKFFVIAFRYNSLLPYDYFTKFRNEWNLRLFNDNKHWFRDYKRIPIIVFCSYVNTVFYGDLEGDEKKDLRKLGYSWLEKGELVADGATICMQCEAIECDYIESLPNKNSLIIEKLNRAVELGFTKAMYELGMKYWKGEYVVKDKIKALELIKAATIDYGPARLFLGNQYFYGNEILEKDFDLAIKYWSMPKCSNISIMKEELYDECTNNLVVVYNSIPNKMNKVKAHLLMDKIKESNSVTIKYNIAWMYQFGEGNYQQNFEKALELYGINYAKKDLFATTRAIYNRAFIHFQNGEYDAGVKAFLESKLSSNSYFQPVYLSSYFFYCGYYKDSENFLNKDISLFHLSWNKLYKNRKIYPFFVLIFFTSIMRLLFNHGKYGKWIYRKINTNGLNSILKKLGSIPLQLMPEGEIGASSISDYNKTTNIIDIHKQQIFLLENYISTINEDNDQKITYYENILNWYKKNKDIIDSPIMRRYWENKIDVTIDEELLRV